MTGGERNGIRALVVDDEQPARQRLTDALALDPAIGAVSEASDGRSAVRIIREERPRLVFLDMQMPELTGFGVIEEVGADRMPVTIFVTAFDQHAVRAFEANALDYLLKPFGDARLTTTIARAKARIDDLDMRDFARRVMRIATESEKRATIDRIAVKSRLATDMILTADIDWIEAQGIYVTLHAGGREHLYRMSLLDLIGRLDPEKFVRVHRSAIVNVERVVRLLPASHGEFEVVCKGGKGPRVSRTYRPLLEGLLGQPL